MFDVGAVVATLELRKDKWNQAIQKVKADQKSLSGMVLRNSAQFRQMGRAMTIAGGAIVASIGLMVKAYANFDKSMTESLAIMGDVSDDMRKKMADMAKTMSEETVYSARDLAAAYFYLASAGMDAAQSIKALPIVAKFAQAGTFDLATATDLLTDAQTALGLSSKDAVENQKNLIRVSDVLVGANTLANASVKQFAESLTNKAAAALVNVNKEVEEGVAVLAAYADKGVKGQLAGQRLTMMLNGLFDATRRNKKAWDEAGISLFEVDGSMRSVADIIQDMEGYLGSMTVQQREAALAALGFNLRTKDSILTLMGSSEKIRKWTEDLKDMGGITEEVSKKQVQTLINQFTILKNKITNAAIAVGETLGPALMSTIEGLKKTIGKISEWIKEHPKLTEIIAKSALAVGGLLAVLGPLMMMLPGLIAALPLIKAGFAGLLGPLGAVTIAIAAVGAGLNVLVNTYKKKQDAEIDAMVEASKSHSKFWELRKKLIAEEIVTVDEWKDIYNKHGRNYKRVMHAIAVLPEYEHIRKRWEEITEAQDAVSDSGEDLAKTLKDEIAAALAEVGEEQKTWLDYLKELGFMTLQEKQDRIIELTGFLNDMHQSYRDGKLDIDDYRMAVKSLNDEITALSTKLVETALPASRDMTGVLEQATTTALNYAGLQDVVGKAVEKRAVAELSMFEKIGWASVIALQQSKLGAIAQATMSTYAGAAKTIELLGMPLAIPFVILAIATGLGQVASIMAVPVPSAEKGAYLPSPTIIEAGHGPLGELILPLDRAPIGFTKETGGITKGAINIDLNFYAPLISTVGLSERDMDRASEYMLEKMKREIERYGGKLNA